MNISLTPKLEQRVRERVASGFYNNASEVVREALRFFFEREAPAVATVAPAALEKERLLEKLGTLQKPLRERGVVSLALFGSFVRDAAVPESDVDLLIGTLPKKPFSLVDLVSVKSFLEAQLGRTVDVVTKEGLDPHIRTQILDEAQAVF